MIYLLVVAVAADLVEDVAGASVRTSIVFCQIDFD